MTKVSPGARILTIPAEKDVSLLVAAAREFNLSLSEEQATALLVEAYYYENESPLYEVSPRPGELKEQLGNVMDHATVLADTLADPITSAHLRHRSACPNLKALADELRKLSTSASEVLGHLPTDTGGHLNLPLREFILSARGIYEDAGGTIKGAYRDSYDGGFSGPFIGLVETTLDLALGDRFDMTNVALGRAIERALEERT